MHLFFFRSGYYITGIGNPCIHNHNHLMHYMCGVFCRSYLFSSFNIVDGYCSGSVLLASFGCKTQFSVIFKCPA